VLPGFGHAGLGGSIGWADPGSRIAFGFVHNRLLTPMIFDQATFIGLGVLLRRGAAAARRHGYHVVPDLRAAYPKPVRVAAGPDFRRWWAHGLPDCCVDLRERLMSRFGSCYYTARCSAR
ncbi:MAG TPA: hypothetical protein VEH31_34775, partial [Streptosporangiaceae bacterium]|nr:hypothetical protein [Streptosporangiaceae bacterium]